MNIAETAREPADVPCDQALICPGPDNGDFFDGRKLGVKYIKIYGKFYGNIIKTVY